MNRFLPLIILILSFSGSSTHAQKIKTTDLQGKWYITPYYRSDSLEFNFVDDSVTVKLIRHWHTSGRNYEQNNRLEDKFTTDYHLIIFGKEILLVFDVNPDNIVCSTYLIRQLNHKALKLLRIQDAEFRDDKLIWLQKVDSTALIVKRF